MNVYGPGVQSLQKSPVNTGGLCSIAYCKWEDVETFPAPNQVSGIITTALQLKAGKTLYLCQAVDKGRSLEEEAKKDSAGSFMDILVTGTLAGTNTANILSLNSMRFHRWVLIVKDRAGQSRLVGNKDAGAEFLYKYDAEDATGSRKHTLKWNWQHSLSAPVYQSQAFQINIGGQIITAGSLTFIMRFIVGQAGAPMVNAQTLLVNAAFANKNLLVIASGSVLPVDDLTGAIDFTGSIARHIEKAFASTQINFVGGVVQDEIIEIYAWS